MTSSTKKKRLTQFEKAEQISDQAAAWELKAENSDTKDPDILALIFTTAADCWGVASNIIKSLRAPQSKDPDIIKKGDWYETREKECLQEAREFSKVSDSDFD